ncbi:MAG: cysteine desulfurase [Candidatus Buchananbacteria bacterium CG10_big_fil_rev_8_21_14_0_10_42_9]|uniref:Cysteine desulfurase n=1 Tax=Candidatus Buchananbacteria bacterium CG10_big_fil_rev_8_21_14_0_10_42_9 TaxID=1974526 RepID=A0A2H0W009_9BACT|nr:MAG: cysteine desulfurase [Candidatus Buchananbacteria bacterium CG10_big_fil_rev_8_21_14_0_10_42_9]
MFNVEKIRRDFPILKQKVNGQPLVYFDNANTTQKPKAVIEAVTNVYSVYNANVHRAMHSLGVKTTVAYEGARQICADFIHAETSEIIFTSGATAALNILAYGLGKKLKRGDVILVSAMEHHSNFVPWQQIAKAAGATLQLIEVDKAGQLVINEKQFTNNVKIVAVTLMSNVFGTITDVNKVAKLAHKVGAKIVVDAAQGAAHVPIDVAKLNCDFLAFSGHKMLGPTGIGVLYGKKELLENLDPLMFGGEMILEVKVEETIFNDVPYKFEAGTTNIAGAIGLGAAIKYLQSVGLENIYRQEQQLLIYLFKQLKGIPEVQVVGGTNTSRRGGVVTFILKTKDGQVIHSHDLAEVLDSFGIAIRGGHFCAMPLMAKLGIVGASRASFYLYNTETEIDVFVKALIYARDYFSK